MKDTPLAEGQEGALGLGALVQAKVELEELAEEEEVEAVVVVVVTVVVGEV